MLRMARELAWAFIAILAFAHGASAQQVSGYEIRRGQTATLVPNRDVSAQADCPSGKIALGAGFETQKIAGSAPVLRALTVRGSSAFVTLRGDAGLSAGGGVTSIAVCVDDNRRTFTNTQPATANPNARAGAVADCSTLGGVLIGGGFESRNDIWSVTSAPEGARFNAQWTAAVDTSASAAGSVISRSVCHTNPLHGSWEIAFAQDIVVREKTAQIQIECKAPMRPLAVGFDGRASTASRALRVLSLQPIGTSDTWVAEIVNAPDPGGPDGRVSTGLSAICATVGPPVDRPDEGKITDGEPPPTPTPPAGLTGYQVVQNTVIVGASKTAAQTAVCPGTKVAISAGFKVVPVDKNVKQAEVERALEVKEFRPVWPTSGGQTYGRVEVRNAHVFQNAELTVFAVCVDRRPDINLVRRLGDAAGADATNRKGVVDIPCATGEIAIGGGTETIDVGHIKRSRPGAFGNSWTSEVVQSGFGSVVPHNVTTVCALGGMVTQPTPPLANSGPTNLAALSETAQTARCPAGNEVFAAGIDDNSSLAGIDMIPVALEPSGTGAWTTKVHNRNLLGATDSVIAETWAICGAATR